jgi:tetratricopeptide (TPR) repeat protein
MSEIHSEVPSKINAEFIERYQLLYQQDPKSKVFAPLAEAYRKSKMLDEAFEIAFEGVQKHPHFPGGHLTLARVYLDLGKVEEASQHLKKTVELSPENILAQILLAESLLKLRKPKEALKSFKMVLFLNPNDERAQTQVRKLESLTADEYEEEVFKSSSPFQSRKLIPTSSESSALTSPMTSAQKQRSLERLVSLADAYLVRHDWQKALEIVNEAEDQVGGHPEISKRKKLLMSRLQPEVSEEKTFIPAKNPLIERSRKIEQLEVLLQRINERRHP